MKITKLVINLWRNNEIYLDPPKGNAYLYIHYPIQSVSRLGIVFDVACNLLQITQFRNFAAPTRISY